jgi:hypothetical protein
VILVWSGVVVVAVTAVAITAMLLVRRRAPEGSYFEDGDRAAGVFGVLATGFAVLLGFVVFLAFESYDTSRSGAETEAQLVRQQFETAQLFPARVRPVLSGQLVCYARSVIHQEWPRMEAGDLGDTLNPWVFTMFRTLRTVVPQSVPEQTAYAKWFDQRSDREDARADRVHGAEGVIPVPLWIVLLLSAAIIFVFMMFFADSGERRRVQAVQIGSVAVMIVVTLAVIRVLDNPFGYGGLKPVAMQRTLHLLEQSRAVVWASGALPCDADGRPT